MIKNIFRIDFIAKQNNKTKSKDYLLLGLRELITAD